MKKMISIVTFAKRTLRSWEVFEFNTECGNCDEYCSRDGRDVKRDMSSYTHNLSFLQLFELKL